MLVRFLCVALLCGLSFGTAIAQDDGDSAKATPRYRVALVKSGDRRSSAIRVEVRSGKCWQMWDQRWEKIKEPKGFKPGKNSTFVVQMVQVTENGFAALRLDEHTGQAWKLDQDHWIPIVEYE